MIEKVVSPREVTVMEKTLAADSLRHKVISNNIANANTPGFKRSDVTFAEELSKAFTPSNKLQLTVTNDKHIGGRQTLDGQPAVVEENSTSFRADGNNVDIDREMTNMAKNQIHYNVLVQKIAGFYAKLKDVIKEGK